jgi:hypothetical protein
MFPAKSEEILTPVSLCEPHIFWRQKIWNFEFPPSAPSSPLIVFLGSFDDDRQPSQFDCITIDLRNFFPRPEGKCIATIRRLDPVTAPPPTSPRKACSVVPAPPKLFWEESKVAIMLSSVERWGRPGIIPPALSLTS